MLIITRCHCPPRVRAYTGPQFVELRIRRLTITYVDSIALVKKRTPNSQKKGTELPREARMLPQYKFAFSQIQEPLSRERYRENDIAQHDSGERCSAQQHTDASLATMGKVGSEIQQGKLKRQLWKKIAARQPGVDILGSSFVASPEDLNVILHSSRPDICCFDQWHPYTNECNESCCSSWRWPRLAQRNRRNVVQIIVETAEKHTSVSRS